MGQGACHAVDEKCGDRLIELHQNVSLRMGMFNNRRAKLQQREPAKSGKQSEFLNVVLSDFFAGLAGMPLLGRLRASYRGHAGNVQRKNDEIHCRSGMTNRQQRRIHGPSTTESRSTDNSFYEHRQKKQNEGGWQKPERDVVQSREAVMHQRSSILLTSFIPKQQTAP